MIDRRSCIRRWLLVRADAALAAIELPVASLRRRLHELRPVAPATYRGFQQGWRDIPGFEIWNLTRSIRGHSINSTVSRQTLISHGYRVPEIPHT